MTSRVVLSVVVVVAGVGVGRQVLNWWREAADAIQSPHDAVPAIGDPSAAHEIAIGDRPWSIVRQTLQGDANAATNALLAACQNAAEETRGEALTTPGPGERELLARLAGSKPQRRSPRGVSLYSLRDGIPLVVGTRATASESSVAIWGMAVPTSPTSWSLYTFRPEASSTINRAVLPRPPLPPECRCLLQVRAVDGEVSIVFTGPSQADQWREFYDRWADETGLQAASGWQESGDVWHIAYESTVPNTATVIRIHLGITQTGASRGLILAGPR